ncbi:FGFR1 oncogene partner 2 homolog [Drosophila eugracilis]|uniref:FGFR1 oncogene partner 2 homolog n=1 Tax=Drosophila eugracilis TaxID=29029 RepID=UPI001BDB3463|nr:FGFR1 oncogene partner 2 homolog [Drosophila eugracilis]
MGDAMSPGPIEALINKAKDISDSMAELEIRADELLKEAEKVNQDLANCRQFREEQVLKYLSENSDKDQMEMLRENIELKETAEEFHQGIKKIMEKFREHKEDDMFIDSYQLKERYLAGLTEVVLEQDARIEKMVEVMKLIAEVEDRSSEENQEVIRYLSRENEEMRRKLQISNKDEPFRQGTLGSSENSTQIELTDSLDPNAFGANSISSLDSFLSCLSPSYMENGSPDDGSPTSSLVSELEINCFIEEALSEKTEELPTSQEEQTS